jgi:hypothetical protein
MPSIIPARNGPFAVERGEHAIYSVIKSIFEKATLHIWGGG